MTTVTTVDPGKAYMVFHVPAEASIYLKGQKMTSNGALRTFNSPVLKTGQTYAYPIRVELVRNGQTLQAEGVQMVRAGDRVELQVNLNSDNGQLRLSQIDGQKSVLELAPSNSPLVSQK